MSIRALYNEYVITTKPTANRSLSITLETYPYLFLSICANAETTTRNQTLEDNYKRIEDAVYSVAGAIEHGVMSGGYGFPYAYLGAKIDDVGTPAYIIYALTYINKVIFDGKKSDDSLDSALVISEVIKNAFTMAAQVATTNAIVYDSIHYNT